MSMSQARQDEFAMALIDKGTFIDVGCYLPIKDNNTKRLEDNGWTGLAFDIVNYSSQWEDRKTKFIRCDVLKCDWGVMLHWFDDIIDYLSLDIDSGSAVALKRITDVKEFKVITVEHDVYKPGNLTLEAEPQRKLLKSLGYQMVAKNVRHDTRPFEDWWINPKYIYTDLYLENVHCNEVIRGVCR